TFAIGMTEEIFPQKIENKTLLSDEERQTINDTLTENQYLRGTTGRKIAQEPFVAYLVFSSARERLYLTYPSVKDTAQEVKPSPYFKNIQKDLNLPVFEKNETTIFDDETTSLAHISTYR
ncbi:hypothetical protein, partial [Enterococcus faecalis]